MSEAVMLSLDARIYIRQHRYKVQH